MKKLNKKQPVPPSKKYTSKDSAALVGTVGRFKKNIDAYQKAPTVKTAGGSFKKGLPQDIMQTMRSQADSIDRNPYTPTYIQREKAKAGSGGGMKSTKVASKSMAKAAAKKVMAKKMMPKKK